MTLRVELVAQPDVDYAVLGAAGYVPHPYTAEVTSADELIEFSGRQCYTSWDRPNPATATNAGYINHAVHEMQHESILEHAHVVVRVTGISRSLLLELERHRHLSFSVLSQRFVDEAKRGADPVIPPLFRGTRYERILQDIWADLLEDYERIVTEASAEWPQWRGKQIREAARAIMPNMTPTEAVISANLRAWRYVIRLRSTPQADAEIRELARELLVVLRRVAPNVMADFPTDADA